MSATVVRPEQETDGPDRATLLRASVSGVLWQSCSKVGAQGLQAVTRVILARLLGPREFGLVGMATVVTGVVGLFRELGLASAIVQRKDLAERHRSSGFWLNIATGVVLCALGLAVAPLGARIFHEPRVGGIAQVLSVTFIISSAAIVQEALLRRSLRFRDLAVRDLVGIAAGGVTGITLALLGFGVWALVWGSVASATVSTIVLWLLGDWRPRLCFDRASAGELFGFGSKILGTGLINYAIRNIDYLVVGRILGAAALGLYALAYRMLLLPLEQVTRVVCAVLFPALSHLQRDDEMVRKGHLKAVTYVAAVALPLEAGIFTIAPEAIPTLLGPQWTDAILPARILCLVAALESIGAPVWTAVDAKGRPDVSFKWSCGLVGFQVVAILIGVRHGIVGVAAAITAVSVVAFPVGQSISFRFIGTKWRDLGRALAPSVLGAGLMVAVMLPLQNHLASSVVGGPARLVLLVVVGIAVYAGYAALSQRHPGREMLGLILSLRQKPLTGAAEVAEADGREPEAD